PMPVALDEPLAVVELHEGTDGRLQRLDRVPPLRPDHLFLQGADEPFGAAVARRLPDVGRGVFDPKPGERPGEVRARVLRAPVVPAADPAGHVRTQRTEAVP